MIKLIAQTEAINSLVLQGVNFFLFYFHFILLYFCFFVFWSYKEQILKETIKV